ncbi:hypothetical protein [Pseudoxanthomonas beigongshangi]
MAISKVLLATMFLLAVSCAGEAAQISSDSNLVQIEGSAIKLNLGREFPGNVGVIAPNGNFYVVRDDEINCLGIEFLDKGVVLDTLRLSGVLWDDGRPRTELIFTVTGNYKIVVADNLETELDGANASVITVHYVRSNVSNTTKSAKCVAPLAVK